MAFLSFMFMMYCYLSCERFAYSYIQYEIYKDKLLVLGMNKHSIRKVPKLNTKLNCILKLEKVIF